LKKQKALQEYELCLGNLKRSIIENENIRILLGDQTEKSILELKNLKSKLLSLDYIGPLYKNYSNINSINEHQMIYVVERMGHDLEMFVRLNMDFNIEDYCHEVGDDFKPICGLLYKLKQEQGEIATIKNALKRLIETQEKTPLDDIIIEYQDYRNRSNNFLDKLKGKMKQKGVYCRKVGDGVEYYGITNELYDERDRYKSMCDELREKINFLKTKFEEMQKPFTKQKKRKI